MNKESKMSINLGAMATGALVGAAAVAFSHKPTRKKMKEKLVNALEMGDEKIDKLENVASDKKDEAKQKLNKVKKSAKDQLVNSLDKAQKKLEETEV